MTSFVVGKSAYSIYKHGRVNADIDELMGPSMMAPQLFGGICSRLPMDAVLARASPDQLLGAATLDRFRQGAYRVVLDGKKLSFTQSDGESA